MTDALAHLLAVQDRDTSITQLEHRRAALVETTGLAAAEAQLASLEAERADAAARRAVLTATQKDLEGQIAVLQSLDDLFEIAHRRLEIQRLRFVFHFAGRHIRRKVHRPRGPVKPAVPTVSASRS